MPYTIQLFAELEKFQLQEMGLNTLVKAAQFEKDFDAWKIKNGFPTKCGADCLADEFRANLTSAELTEYYSR